MKKIFAILAFLLILVGAAAAWLLLGSSTAFEGKHKFVYIRTGSHAEEVVRTLAADSVLRHPSVFKWLAGRLGYWESIKPGKYEIQAGTSTLSLVRKLRSGQQSPVNLVINKVRTKEQLAAQVGRKFECDSASFLSYMNSAQLRDRYGLDSHSVMTLIIPDTYTYFWNSTPEIIFNKLEKRYQNFWTEERKNKAAAKGLTPTQVYILASIVEEETNKHDEKGNVASVYLNRIKKGMPLQADPTVKFALQNFGLTRIREGHLAATSPYNTYRNKGLPPGPICTPSAVTLDAVLDAPETQYIYFVAKSDFSGYHVFAQDYPTHLKYAREYRKALDSLEIRRQKKKADQNLKNLTN